MFHVEHFFFIESIKILYIMAQTKQATFEDINLSELNKDNFLVRCNNCMAIMESDFITSQSIGFSKDDIKGKEILELEVVDVFYDFIGESDIKHCCPNCHTDDYLMDVTELEQLK